MATGVLKEAEVTLYNFLQEPIIISADEVEIRQNTEKMLFRGHVAVFTKSGSLSLKGEQLVLKPKTQELTSMSSIVIESKGRKTLTAERFVCDFASKKIVLIGTGEGGTNKSGRQISSKKVSVKTLRLAYTPNFKIY